MPAPIYACWQVPRSFSGEKIVADKADEAAGLTPSNEDNDVSGNFSLEKPYCPLSIDGILILIRTARIVKLLDEKSRVFHRELDFSQKPVVFRP